MVSWGDGGHTRRRLALAAEGRRYPEPLLALLSARYGGRETTPLALAARGCCGGRRHGRITHARNPVPAQPSEKACKELGVGTTVLKRGERGPEPLAPRPASQPPSARREQGWQAAAAVGARASKPAQPPLSPPLRQQHDARALRPLAVCRNFGIPRWPYRSRRRRSPSAAASSSDSPSSGASPSPSRSSLLGGSASGAEASGTAAARPAAAAAAAVGAEHPAARLAWRTTPPAGPAMLQPSWGADAAAAAISPQLRLLSPPGAAPGQQGPRKPVGFRPYSRLPPDSGGSGQGSGEQQEPSQQAQQQAQQQLAGPTGPEPDAMLRLLAELAQPAAAAAATAAAAPLAQAPSGGRGEKRKRSPDHPVTVLLLSAPGVGPTAGAGLGPLPAAGLLPSRGSDETQASVAAADPELQVGAPASLPVRAPLMHVLGCCACGGSRCASHCSMGMGDGHVAGRALPAFSTSGPRS